MTCKCGSSTEVIGSNLSSSNAASIAYSESISHRGSSWNVPMQPRSSSSLQKDHVMKRGYDRNGSNVN